MNIDELIKKLVIEKKDYKSEIKKDEEINNYISQKSFDEIFQAMERSVQSKFMLKTKYTKGYSRQPSGCNNKKTLVFAPLNGNRADNSRWIARMPLQKNAQSIFIYFPRDIIIPNAKQFFESQNVKPYKYTRCSTFKIQPMC